MPGYVNSAYDSYERVDLLVQLPDSWRHRSSVRKHKIPWVDRWSWNSTSGYIADNIKMCWRIRDSSLFAKQLWNHNHHKIFGLYQLGQNSYKKTRYAWHSDTAYHRRRVYRNQKRSGTGFKSWILDWFSCARKQKTGWSIRFLSRVSILTV